MSVTTGELLSKWHEAKAQIAELEKKCEKYKKVAEKMMRDEGTSRLDSSRFSLTRKDMTRGTLSKADVPIDVWNKYSRKTSYPAYFLVQK